MKIRLLVALIMSGWASWAQAQSWERSVPDSLRMDQPSYHEIYSWERPLLIYSSMVRAETMDIIQDVDWQIDRWSSHPKLQQPLTIREVYKTGDRHANISLLRVALQEKGFFDVLGELSADHGDQKKFSSSELFDEELTLAVKAAQEFYGLKQDGVAGPLLYENLNADPLRIRHALHQLRGEWLNKIKKAQQQGHEKIVFVNIPSFTLRAVDLTTGRTRVETRVIVGMPSRKTPRYLTHVVNLKFNPEWTPPPSLRARGKSFAPPGPNNPMGRVRFSTNRSDNIYLHHTNDMGLFEKNNRALSSGCVRVEKWDDLVKFLANKTEDSLMPFIGDWRTRFYSIDPVPVWIDYHLVDVVNQGSGKHLDVYGIGSKY